MWRSITIWARPCSGTGRVKEAIVEFNKALEDPLYPTPHFVYYNLGQAYFALKEFDKARENYYGGH